MSYPPPPHQPPPPGTPGQHPPTGALPWGLGLLVLVCVPFFSSVLAGGVMAAVGHSTRRHGGPGGENGRNAANWGLTYVVATVVLVGTHFGLLFALTRDEPMRGFFPLGIPITIWGVVSLAHLVISVLGIIKASRGDVFAPPAIPFLRATSR